MNLKQAAKTTKTRNCLVYADADTAVSATSRVIHSTVQDFVFLKVREPTSGLRVSIETQIACVLFSV